MRKIKPRGDFVSKKESLITCVIYAVIIVAFGLSIFVFPERGLLAHENRIAAELPVLSGEAILDKSFFEGFSKFCNDSFPFRERLLTLNSSVELCFGKLEAGGVMAGKNGNLIKQNACESFEQLKANAEAIDRICGYARAQGADTLFFCVPSTADVLADYVPLPWASSGDREVWQYVRCGLDMKAELRQRANAGEYVYYRTDHHWTTLGAYYAYCKLGQQLGFSPYPISDFHIECVSEDFLGSTYSSALFPFVSPDRIDAFRYDGDSHVSVTDLSTGKLGGLYDFAALSGNSKYDFFLGGNRAHMSAESGKPRLILVKDSFANSLVPFLARHYDIDIIDPRYLRKPIDNLLLELYSEGDAPTLLVLFGIDTLTGNIGL